MVEREVGEDLMELQRTLIESGMPEGDAIELVDEFEARIAEELGDDDGGEPEQGQG